MRPLVVLLRIVMGSTVSIALVLLLSELVFLLLPEYRMRLADEHRPLVLAFLLSLVLAAISATSFYAELRRFAWRFSAHGALTLMLGIALWAYWPK